jgi:hypothetical protein
MILSFDQFKSKSREEDSMAIQTKQTYFLYLALVLVLSSCKYFPSTFPAKIAGTAQSATAPLTSRLTQTETPNYAFKSEIMLMGIKISVSYSGVFFGYQPEIYAEVPDEYKAKYGRELTYWTAQDLAKLSERKKEEIYSILLTLMNSQASRSRIAKNPLADYDQALFQITQQNYAAAIEILNTLLDNQTSGFDLPHQARFLRGLAYLGLNKRAESHADLEQLQNIAGFRDVLPLLALRSTAPEPLPSASPLTLPTPQSSLLAEQPAQPVSSSPPVQIITVPVKQFTSTAHSIAAEEIVPNQQTSPWVYDFTALDNYALSTPEAETSSIQQLAKYLGQRVTTDLEKTRLVFRWITHNISYDFQSYLAWQNNLALRTPDVDQAETVLKTRRGVCAGYANLFMALAQEMGLKVAFIGGSSKGYEFALNQKLGAHAWNAVKIEGKWYLLDSTWGAGYINEHQEFVKSFSPRYFLTPPPQMIIDHFPDNPLWQLLDSPLSQEAFSQLELSERVPKPPAVLQQLNLNSSENLPSDWSLAERNLFLLLNEIRQSPSHFANTYLSPLIAYYQALSEYYSNGASYLSRKAEIETLAQKLRSESTLPALALSEGLNRAARQEVSSYLSYVNTGDWNSFWQRARYELQPEVFVQISASFASAYEPLLAPGFEQSISMLRSEDGFYLRSAEVTHLGLAGANKDLLAILGKRLSAGPSPSPLPSPSPSTTASPLPSSTPTVIPSPTPLPSPTPSPSVTPTPVVTPTPSPSSGESSL